jgi:hypothetical protein
MYKALEGGLRLYFVFFGFRLSENLEYSRLL